MSVLVNTTARVRRGRRLPQGWADEELEGFVALGGEMFSVEVMAPNSVADTDFRRWYERGCAWACHWISGAGDLWRR